MFFSEHVDKHTCFAWIWNRLHLEDSLSLVERKKKTNKQCKTYQWTRILLWERTITSPQGNFALCKLRGGKPLFRTNSRKNFGKRTLHHWLKLTRCAIKSALLLEIKLLNKAETLTVIFRKWTGMLTCMLSSLCADKKVKNGVSQLNHLLCWSKHSNLFLKHQRDTVELTYPES